MVPFSSTARRLLVGSGNAESRQQLSPRSRPRSWGFPCRAWRGLCGYQNRVRHSQKPYRCWHPRSADPSRQCFVSSSAAPRGSMASTSTSITDRQRNMMFTDYQSSPADAFGLGSTTPSRPTRESPGLLTRWPGLSFRRSAVGSFETRRRTSPSIGTLNLGLDLDRHGAVREPRAMCGLAGPERPPGDGPGMGVPPDRRSMIFHLPNPYSGVRVKTRVAIVL
jgi:hypothetical protein